MKITVFTLCVVLPSLCVCTPLPDYGCMPPPEGGSCHNANPPPPPPQPSSGSCPNANPQSPPPPPPPHPSGSCPNANPPPRSGGCSDANGSANAGKPNVQGFTNYSVLKISFEEFKTKINKITWHLAKYTPSSEEVKTDVTICADRYIKDCECCKAVKFQYVIEEKGFVVKEWGLTEKLIYIQEEITASSQEFVILKAEVKNVMKADKDSDKAEGVGDDKQVKSYLSSEYAVLGTDYKNFFIGQTSCDKGAITFIAFIEEIYLCEEKQQQFAEQISQILKASGIDESKLQKLTQKFDVDTNKYNKKNKGKTPPAGPCDGHSPQPGPPQPQGPPPCSPQHQGPPPCHPPPGPPQPQRPPQHQGPPSGPPQPQGPHPCQPQPQRPPPGPPQHQGPPPCQPQPPPPGPPHPQGPPPGPPRPQGPPPCHQQPQCPPPGPPQHQGPPPGPPRPQGPPPCHQQPQCPPPGPPPGPPHPQCPPPGPCDGQGQQPSPPQSPPSPPCEGGQNPSPPSANDLNNYGR